MCNLVISSKHILGWIQIFHNPMSQMTCTWSRISFIPHLFNLNYKAMAWNKQKIRGNVRPLPQFRLTIGQFIQFIQISLQRLGSKLITDTAWSRLTINIWSNISHWPEMGSNSRISSDQSRVSSRQPPTLLILVENYIVKHCSDPRWDPKFVVLLCQLS